MNKRSRAKHLFKHYIRQISPELMQDRDVHSELDELIDAIIDAAKEELREDLWFHYSDKY